MSPVNLGLPTPPRAPAGVGHLRGAEGFTAQNCGFLSPDNSFYYGAK